VQALAPTPAPTTREPSGSALHSLANRAAGPAGPQYFRPLPTTTQWHPPSAALATAEANGKGCRCARLSKQLHSPAVLGRLSRLAVSLPRHRVAPAGPGLTGTLRWPAQWACRAGAACAPPDLGRWLKPPGRAVFPSPSRRSCLAVARVAVRPATSVGLLPWAAAYLVIASGSQAGTRAGGRGAAARAGGPARRPAAALRRRRLPPRSLAPIPPPPSLLLDATLSRASHRCCAGPAARRRRAAPRRAAPGPAIVASFGVILLPASFPPRHLAGRSTPTPSRGPLPRNPAVSVLPPRSTAATRPGRPGPQKPAQMLLRRRQRAGAGALGGAHGRLVHAGVPSD